MPRRGAFLAAIVGLLAIVIALPALAGSPASGPDKSGKSKAEKTSIELEGQIAASTNAKGKTTYTLKSGATTYTLGAGPSWFFGDNHPLKPYVGKSVTVVGEVAAGSTEVNVTSVNGTALRAPGKPPWAGGWRKVGKLHPGWSQARVDRFKARFGDCFPPGRCQQKPAKDRASQGGPGASEQPEASERPDNSEAPEVSEAP